jgi:hypothetical protein
MIADDRCTRYNEIRGALLLKLWEDKGLTADLKKRKPEINRR